MNIPKEIQTNPKFSAQVVFFITFLPYFLMTLAGSIKQHGPFMSWKLSIFLSTVMNYSVTLTKLSYTYRTLMSQYKHYFAFKLVLIYSADSYCPESTVSDGKQDTTKKKI